MIPTPKAMRALIQIGERTQIQDHAITLVSFRVMNTRVRSPTNPIPPDDDVSVLIVFYLLVMVMRNSLSIP